MEWACPGHVGRILFILASLAVVTGEATAANQRFEVGD